MKSNYEHALYLKKSGDKITIVGVYVDDLIITGSNSNCIENFKTRMKTKLEMSDLGSLSSYLGLEVKQDRDFIFQSQKTYAMKIIEHAKMENCKAVFTPLEARKKFTHNETKMRVNSMQFRSLIGSLRYLTHMRPDLLYIVDILSRLMENPTVEHFSGVKRILRYIKGIVDCGFCYKKGSSNCELLGFSDNDFAGDVGDCKSTFGHIYFLREMAINWSS